MAFMEKDFFERMEKFFENFSVKMDELREGTNELREGINELKESQQRTDEQIKRTSDQILELKESQDRTDEQMKRTDEQIKRTDEKLERIGKRLGSLGIAQGEFAEELFYRSLEDSPVLGDIIFDEVERRVRISAHDYEFDIILKNGSSIGLVEVKYKAHPEEICEIVKKRTETFRKRFNEYSGHKLYFGLATTITTPNLINKAKEEGIFLLTQKGDHMEIVNSDVKSH